MEKNTIPNITVVIPTLGRQSLAEAKASCGSIPVEVEKDPHQTGAGLTRNRAIQRVRTDWVGFLDDDDRFTPDYLERFNEALAEDPDVIIFRMQYPDGRILPKVPEVIWSNVGISFAVKRKYADNLFVKGENAFEQNEDYLALKKLEDDGRKIVFSPHVTYLVKPSESAQATAKINQEKNEV